MRVPTILTLFVLLSLGCDGMIHEPGAVGPGDPNIDRDGDGIPDINDPVIGPPSIGEECVPDAEPASVAQQRRLSPEEYNNTVRDLVGDSSFETPIEAGETWTERGVRQLRDAASAAVERRSEWSFDIYGCEIDGSRDDACAESFIETFGRRAFRRPLSESEQSWLNDVYTQAVTELSFTEAMEIVTEVILQSPQVVYLTEGTTSGVHQALNDYELASRLSFLLWQTTPDDTLLDAAAAGELSEPEGMREQAERLLADPRAEETVQRFFWEWMQLNGGRLHNSLEELSKDSERFPEFNDEVRSAMRHETEAFIRRIVFETDGSLRDLLLDRNAYVNAALAQLYGVEGPASDDEWEWVQLDESQRAGLFTRSAFLTVFAAERVHSPIRRGVFTLEEVLCVELGDPPPNANDQPVEGGETEGGVRSVREDVNIRTQGNDCQACHAVINPVGFAFENYDAIGRFQTHEVHTGLEIDSTGRIQQSDVDGAVSDAVELNTALSESRQVAGCFVEKWVHSALRAEADPCLVAELAGAAFEGASIRELIIRIIESPQFRYIR